MVNYLYFHLLLPVQIFDDQNKIIFMRKIFEQQQELDATPISEVKIKVMG